jgi:AraC-like DNA-binding protein
MNLMNILGNVIFPIVSGIIMMVFVAYFIFSRSLQTKASRFFVVYLFSFGLFVVLRPYQLFIGPHPGPLYVNMFRAFVMMAIAIPSLVIANLSFVMPLRYRMVVPVYAFGILMGILYGMFNSLATESYVAFILGGLPAYEPLLPSGFTPFYPREATIAIFVIGGVQAAATGAYLTYKELRSGIKHHVVQKKYLLFGLSSLVLGLSIIYGVLIKLWGIYYIAALFSSLFAGSGILSDIRELQTRVEKTLPYIRSELVSIIRFNRKKDNELYELFNTLELSTRINTFIIMECRYNSPKTDSLELFDVIFQDVEPLVIKRFGEKEFLLVPIGRYKIGICVAIRETSSLSRLTALELCEDLMAAVQSKKELLVSFGIGRSKEDATGLSDSYHEAATAQAYAAFFKKNQMVHIDDVQDPAVKNLDSVLDFSDLSVSIKTGNLQSSLQQFDSYFSRMVQASQGELEHLRMRSMHLVSSIVQDAMAVGIAGVNLVEKSNSLFKELLEIEKEDALRGYLEKVIEETVSAIALSQKNKLSKVVVDAKNFIDANSTRQLTIQEVADHVGMSHSYLCPVFKRETGFTVNDYMQKARISLAKRLLAEGKSNITEIAYALGFNDSNYFSTAFKKAEGVSPSAYRKALQQKML